MNHRVLDRRRLLITLAALERRLWQPLGFAKLGVLYARGGAWQGHQLVPRDWVQGPTVVPTDDGSNPAPGNGFFWWVQSDRRPPAFLARGRATRADLPTRAMPRSRAAVAARDPGPARSGHRPGSGTGRLAGLCDRPRPWLAGARPVRGRPARRGAGHGRRGGHHGRAGAAGPQRHRPVRDLGLRLDLVLLAGSGVGRWLLGTRRP